MKKFLEPLLENGKLLILGFGKEGRSTLRYITAAFPGIPISIADRDESIAAEPLPEVSQGRVTFHLGENYLDALHQYSLIIKSPGVKLPAGFQLPAGHLLTSQTRLMLKAYHRQMIGVTGTKGKSTTSSLVHHLLETSGLSSVLVGNIGLPPFDYLNDISEGTIIVYEMSSHQLQDTDLAPGIAVLLNLYPEHLDHYPSLEAYYSAKMRILEGQEPGDTFIFNEDIPEISARIVRINAPRNYLSFSSGMQVRAGCCLAEDLIRLCQHGHCDDYLRITGDFQLRGKHNRMNMMAALLAARAAGAEDPAIRTGLRTFKGLEHRLEYAGTYQGISFFNDSIATIPEAAIAAIQALPDTDTLILGGYDRMLDYDEMTAFLIHSQVRNFIFMGQAGSRMMKIFNARQKRDKNLFWSDSLEQAVALAFRITIPGKICLLSPAAASYDQFRNFEERGNLFKKLARNHGSLANSGVQ